MWINIHLTVHKYLSQQDTWCGVDLKNTTMPMFIVMQEHVQLCGLFMCSYKVLQNNGGLSHRGMRSGFDKTD